MMKRLVKEPLVHFLLLGGALFLVHGWMNRDEVESEEKMSRVVRISEGDLNWLVEMWSRQWQRQPSPEEMRGLATDLLREQLLAREAEDLGLAENDTIIRRRLAQKLEFVVKDTAQLAEPSETELRQYYQEESERYRTEPHFTFEQVFFNPDARSDAEADAHEALHQVTLAPGEVEGAGDGLMIGRGFANEPLPAVSSLFGGDFAAALSTLEIGAWAGPVRSGYGVHLVRVTKFEPEVQRSFEDVREKVMNDWLGERQREADALYLVALRKKYDVVLDESVLALIGPLGPGEGEEG